MVRETPSTPGRPWLGSPAHGFCDDEETARLLRSRPPQRALAWAERCLGGRVISARALRGGTSSAVHLLTLQTAGGGRRQAVLRRSVREEVNAEEPDIVEREARVLRLIETVDDVPSPLLLGVDPSGESAGSTALVMSRLAGRLDWWPNDVERWLGALAELLPRIHGVTLAAPGVIRPYSPYTPASDRPPPWARHPKVWERAMEIFHDPAPDLPATFIHRDFHPGNVLWYRSRVSGVVDWQAASIGPEAVDVGHCRANLLGFGRQTADRFTRLWEQASGLTYHPWADVVTVVDFLDGLRSDAGSDRFLIEDVLASAVAELS